MTEPELALDDGPVAQDAPRDADGQAAEGRLRELVDTQHDFVWRSLRRLGVPSGDVDDGAQRVFLTASRKLGAIRPGAERSFLFQTALRVAADSRRTHRRRREVAEPAEGERAAEQAPNAEELLDLRRAREQLDRILDEMDLELRAVFVLFELDQLTMAEIAELLDLPPGTVASRLRRARVQFRERAAAPPPAGPAGGAP